MTRSSTGGAERLAVDSFRGEDIVTCSQCQFMSQFHFVIGPIMLPQLHPADVTADVVKLKCKLLFFKAFVVSKEETRGLWVILGPVKSASVRWFSYSCHSGIVLSLC